MSPTDAPQLLLTDQIVAIRPWRDTDAPELFAVVRESHTQLSRWLPWADQYHSAQDAVAWIVGAEQRFKAGTEFAFGIFNAKRGDHCFGGIGLNLFQLDHKLANLGYWVRSSAGRRGLATRAVRLLARHALTTLGFSRVEIITAVENHPSQVVAKKVGALFEGILRDRLWIRQKCVDAHIYSLTRRDPIAKTL